MIIIKIRINPKYKTTLSGIITLAICLLIAGASFYYGTHLDRSIETFCYNQYRNDTVLKQMIGDSPSMFLPCIVNVTQSYGIPWIIEPKENYSDCVLEKADPNEIKFMRNCGDFMADWRSLAFALFLKMAIPLIIFSSIFMAIIDISFKFKKRGKHGRNRK